MIRTSANGAASTPNERAMPEGFVRLLRAARHFAYVCLEPLDYAARIVNGKRDFPPLHLRRYVGPLRTFEMSGAEFVVHLKTLCTLRAQSRVLDIGCGCGLMALHLKSVLDSGGRYVGVDVHTASIDWCRRHISPAHANFTFEHIDVANRAYNPRGRSAEDFSFEFADESFDVILLKSVFTHMRPPDVDAYLGEIKRLLAPGGRCLATFFLLNERQKELAARGRNTPRFDFGEGVWRYARASSPESAVAHDESNVMRFMQTHALKLSEPIAYGTWTGAHDGLSYQDLIVFERQR